METTVVHWGLYRDNEKKMETTIVYFSCSRLIFPKNLTKAVFPFTVLSALSS